MILLLKIIFALFTLTLSKEKKNFNQLKNEFSQFVKEHENNPHSIHLSSIMDELKKEVKLLETELQSVVANFSAGLTCEACQVLLDFAPKEKYI
jgi:hypothetical protein